MTSILIVRLSALGDVVHAMPMVAALRRRCPDARIDWIVDPRYADVVGLVRGINRVIAFDSRSLGGWRGLHRATTVIAALRRARYDVAFDAQGLVKSAVLARLAGAKQTIGFAKAQLREAAAGFFYTETRSAPPDVHVIEKNLALLGAGGPSALPDASSLVLPAFACSEVTALLTAGGFVAMNPGAGWPNKRWPAARFGAVAAAIHERYRLRTLVLWGPGEEALADQVVESAHGTAVRAPKTTAVELFVVLSQARAVIAGDTGPLHMAAAVQAPVVALFGPTSPVRNGAYQTRSVTLSRFEHCECPYQRRCHRGAPCLDDVGVDEVVDAVAGILGEPGAGQLS